MKREATWSRIHLVPLLLAEGDRDAYRRQKAALEREREIMKDVPDWEVSHSSHFVLLSFLAFLFTLLPFSKHQRTICTLLGGMH